MEKLVSVIGPAPSECEPRTLHDKIREVHTLTQDALAKPWAFKTLRGGRKPAAARGPTKKQKVEAAKAIEEEFGMSLGELLKEAKGERSS